MEEDHVKRNEESQRLLRHACEKARKKNGYDWEATRRDLTRPPEEEYKKPPYDWQIDVAETILLGLDAVVIAGTGTGKTIPFMIPLLLHRDKFVFIISPLFQYEPRSCLTILELRSRPLRASLFLPLRAMLAFVSASVMLCRCVSVGSGGETSNGTGSLGETGRAKATVAQASWATS
ncbi:hypothetical protein B0H14DRAFT_3472172 [Mycena olivaceomarginata]|nr:hypothetical protein B0H14DRAFT_3472172 [Mycena olivaceomarginata]